MRLTASRNSGKIVAIYARGRINENGERDESFETQLVLLHGFVQHNGMGKFKEYIDNNESGLNFNRPGLLILVNDIKNNMISAVVVKDLSRLGRDNGRTLTFLEFLKENNVRLISIDNNYNSFINNHNVIGIKCPRDISKKICANLKKKI